MKAQPSSKRKRPRVALLHSQEYARVLQNGMEFIHQDRDALLHSLLDYSGFLRNTPRFFTVVAPRKASRQQLEQFHSSDYLKLLEQPIGGACITTTTGSTFTRDGGTEAAYQLQILNAYGLVEDCPLPNEPAKRAQFWDYCRYVAGASIQAAKALLLNKKDSDDCHIAVAINWGGGRHHAHENLAGGFCYINDVVLAIQQLTRRSSKRVLYLDIDIHHADGVQSAFYDTDQVMTVSFHRHAPGFFPSASGAAHEKGKYGTKGMGYNLNVVLPKLCGDDQFIPIFYETLTTISASFSPDIVVLCVGADGLRNDPLVGQVDGWNLTPEGLAECVRLAATSCDSCSQKLLVLGGGGYNPSETARTFVLCTAAACEVAHPGMLWNDLPKDIPPHEHFPRYGPDFRLVGEKPSYELSNSSSNETICRALKEVKLTAVYIQSQREKEKKVIFNFGNNDQDAFDEMPIVKAKGSSRRRRRVRETPA